MNLQFCNHILSFPIFKFSLTIPLLSALLFAISVTVIFCFVKYFRTTFYTLTGELLVVDFGFGDMTASLQKLWIREENKLLLSQN